MLQEMAWESEKKRFAVAKLRKYFLDDLEVEYIVLHAFRWAPLLLYITSHPPLPAMHSGTFMFTLLEITEQNHLCPLKHRFHITRLTRSA